MAQAALPKLSTRSQFIRARTAAMRDRKPDLTPGRPVLPSQKQRISRSRLNMMPSDELKMVFPNPQTIPQRPEQFMTPAPLLKLLEVENKARLFQERQRIRAQMQAYKLPQMQVDDSLEPDQQDQMQQVFEDEYFQKLQTPEFMNNASEKLNTTLGKDEARKRDQGIKRASKTAANQAQEVAQQTIKAAGGAAKLGWDTAEVVSLVDAIEPADLEIPTIAEICVAMYRGCTAILNDGEKLVKGPLSFIEPQPLFRFWSMKDIKGAMQSTAENPMIGGGGVMENTTESILGWLQVIVGWYALFVIIGSFLGILIFFMLFVLIILRIIGIV